MKVQFPNLFDLSGKKKVSVANNMMGRIVFGPFKEVFNKEEQDCGHNDFAHFFMICIQLVGKGVQDKFY